MKFAIIFFTSLLSLNSVAQTYQKGIIKQKTTNIIGYTSEEMDIIKSFDFEYQFINGEYVVINKALDNILQYSISPIASVDQYKISFINASTKPALTSSTVVSSSDFINSDATYSIEEDRFTTKQIGKFKCYLVNVYSNNGEVIKAYITTLIKSKNSPLDPLNKIKLPGFPLEYTISNQDGQSITFETYYLSSKINSLYSNNFNQLSLYKFKNTHPEYSLIGIK